MPMPMPMFGQMSPMQLGDGIAIPKGMPLPAVCAKCGKTHDLTGRNETFTFAPQWVWFFAIFGLIGIIIAAVIMSTQRKTANFTLALCQACNARWDRGRRNIIIMALGIPVAMVVLSIIVGTVDDDLVALPILLGLLAWVFAPIVYHFAAHRKNTIWSTRVDDMVANLSGWHPDAATAILTVAPVGGYGGPPMGGYGGPPMGGGYGPPPGGGYGPPPGGGYGGPPRPQW
jgi:hypothetical protein